MLTDGISHSGLMFVALRRSGHVQRAQTPVYHAVTPNCRMALCGVEPGAGSGWAEPPATSVTCPKCRDRLARM